MARFLKVSTRTLSRLVTGGLPVVRVGRAKRYVVQDVLEFLKAPIAPADHTASRSRTSIRTMRRQPAR